MNKDLKYKDWEDVNKELKEIGELELMASEIKNKIKEKKEDIEAFCITKKKELKKGDKILQFGSIVYSATEKILLRSKAACATALKSLGLKSYVKDIEEPDKDAMLKLDDEILKKVGASRKLDEEYKINLKK